MYGREDQTFLQSYAMKEDIILSPCQIWWNIGVSVKRKP